MRNANMRGVLLAAAAGVAALSAPALADPKTVHFGRGADNTAGNLVPNRYICMFEPGGGFCQ